MTQRSSDDDTPRAEGFRGVSVAAETARAKVNLTLEILGRRADGYHELRSLVVFAYYGDTLRLEDPEAPFSLDIDGPLAATLEGGNLVETAAALYASMAVTPRAAEPPPPGRGYASALAPAKAEDATRPRGRFHLTKRIPVAAGLGGGSADAAAALRLLAGGTLDRAALDALHGLAARLGADVPVCLLSKPAIMTGIGEHLSILPIFPRIPAVLVNPRVPLATAAVFRELRATPLTMAPPSQIMPPAFHKIDAVLDYAKHRHNDLEAPACRLLPAIGVILDRLARCPGALLARLSGSGPTCFALFREPDEAFAAAERLRADHPGWWIEATLLG